MRRRWFAPCSGAIALAAVCGCAKAPFEPADAGNEPPAVEFDGGTFGDAVAGLTAAELARFGEGRLAFQTLETPASGLGPVFNQPSCAQCHDAPPATGGTNQRLETRFGRRNADGSFDPLTSRGGTLLHDHSIGGVTGHQFAPETLPAEANVIAPRRTQPVFGLGLVDATPDETFAAIAASQAKDNPEAAGRPAMLTDIADGGPAVGRFGWKASNPTLLHFTGDAALNEMGITSPQFPNEICPQGDCAALAFNPAPALNDPEGHRVALFADFMRFLGPPPLPKVTGAAVHGKEVFESIGCAVCHVPTLVTGPNANPAFDHVAYHPFSDFLLHDMGALGDGIDQADARGAEMRTQPLWGLSTQTRMLHDGRAVTVSAAILAHDGQGKPARARFAALTEADREAVLAFLGAL